MSTSSSSNDNSVRIRDYTIVSTSQTTEQTTESVKNVNERGIIKNTASAVEETTIAARDTIHTFKDATREAAETAPTTIKTLKEVSDKVRSKITEKSSSN